MSDFPLLKRYQASKYPNFGEGPDGCRCPDCNKVFEEGEGMIERVLGETESQDIMVEFVCVKCHQK